MPKIDIRRPCYAMASKDGENAEITMYGGRSTGGPEKKPKATSSSRTSF